MMEPMICSTDKQVSYFARTNFRDDHRIFGIKQTDRRSHMYVIGRTGTGKSTLLETLAIQDVHAGRGFALFDPHGDLADSIRRGIPPERQIDVIDFDVPHVYETLGFNPLAQVHPSLRNVAASGILSAFKKMWPTFWGPRMEHVLRNSLLTLLDQADATLADIPRLYHDASFRQGAIRSLTNEQVRDFWTKEYAKYPPYVCAQAIAPILNKVGGFISDPKLYSILTNSEISIDLRSIMDEGKILLVNLAKGKLGQDASGLLGSLIVSMFEVAGLSRADESEEQRRDFHIYIDEFHNFTTESLAGMLSELRKYHVCLVLAHQHLSQLPIELRDAVLGNVGTTVTFRIGVVDARLLEKEFFPKFQAEDLVRLRNYDVYLKLMIDGTISPPFSATTIRHVDIAPSRNTM